MNKNSFKNFIAQQIPICSRFYPPINSITTIIIKTYKLLSGLGWRWWQYLIWEL